MRGARRTLHVRRSAAPIFDGYPAPQRSKWAFSGSLLGAVSIRAGSIMGQRLTGASSVPGQSRCVSRMGHRARVTVWKTRQARMRRSQEKLARSISGSGRMAAVSVISRTWSRDIRVFWISPSSPTRCVASDSRGKRSPPTWGGTSFGYSRDASGNTRATQDSV